MFVSRLGPACVGKGRSAPAHMYKAEILLFLYFFLWGGEGGGGTTHTHTYILLGTFLHANP